MGSGTQDNGTIQPGAWRFGAVVVDTATATVTVAGRSVELDRSSYDLLLALLRHAGDVVGKEELLEAGWPGRIVSENSLAKAISRLRQSLGEDATALRVVHGYGYRLVAIVRYEPRATDAPTDSVIRVGDSLPNRPGWTLVARLGDGGSGTTFLAATADGRQRVIKFAHDEAGLATLKREIALTRYIRAVRTTLDDIVPVLDWNLGQVPLFIELPYFPDGSLRDWAQARGGLRAVEPRQRLDLAIALCEAVAALHEIGIVHRDLKPQNLYPYQAPRGDLRLAIADFGASVATVLPKLAELGLTLTADVGGHAPIAGTALYIAPEVIAGELPTQRSDVFALGVLVYQLVAGDLRRPFAPGWEADIGDALLREDIGLAAASNPERRLVDARALGERLRTLDERREAAAREADARAVAQRREQQLEREIHRRRMWLGTAIAAGLGLIGMLGLYTYAEHARRTAERNAQQRQALVDFVTGDVLAQADPYRGSAARADMPVGQAVDAAAATVDARFSGDPAAAAAVHELVGNVYFGRDRHAQAIAHYTRALALLPAGTANTPERVRIETELCDVQRIAYRLADAESACTSALQHAESRTDREFATLKVGQLREEQERHADALALLKPLLDSRSLRADARKTAELLWTLGQAERGLADYAGARAHFEALLAHDQRAGIGGTWLAWAYNSLGSVLVETGDYAASEPMLVKARALFLQTQGEGVEANMPNVWRSEARLRSGQWADARALLTGMQSVWAASLAPTHPLRLRADANLAWAEAMLGDGAAASHRMDTALADRGRVFDPQAGRIAARAERWLRAALALHDAAAAATLMPILKQAVDREYPAHHPMHALADCLGRQVDALQTPGANADSRWSRCGPG